MNGSMLEASRHRGSKPIRVSADSFSITLNIRLSTSWAAFCDQSSSLVLFLQSPGKFESIQVILSLIKFFECPVHPQGENHFSSRKYQNSPGQNSFCLGQKFLSLAQNY